jgi:hypothetical protein
MLCHCAVLTIYCQDLILSFPATIFVSLFLFSLNSLLFSLLLLQPFCHFSFLLTSLPPVSCRLKADCITHLFRCPWGSTLNLHYLKFITTFESIYAQPRRRSVNKWCRDTNKTQGRCRALWILEWGPSYVRTRVDDNDCVSVTCVTPRRFYLIMHMAISWVALLFCSLHVDLNHCKNDLCLVNIKTVRVISVWSLKMF